MLALIILWLLLLVVCVTTGLTILHWTGSDHFDRIGDRLIVAVWLGLAGFSLLLQATSLVFPLSHYVGILLAGVLVLLSLLASDTRADLKLFGAGLSPQLSLTGLALVAGLALYIAQPVKFFDTGLYHFPAIRWLSQFGTVPGLSSVDIRFSFTSSWFALAAPFNSSASDGRLAALPGGFALLLAIIHLLLCARRCLLNSARIADWLALSALTLVIVVSVHLSSFISPSPDIPVMLLTIVVAWTVMVALNRPQTGTGVSQAALGSGLVPFILSMAAVTIKLSAAPLVIVSALFCLRRFRGKDILILSVVGLVMIAPTIATQTIYSGCPLFPSDVLCVNVPWKLDSGAASRIAGVITEWARWDGPAPPHATAFNWLGRWLVLGTSLKSKPLVLSLIVTMGGCAILVLRRRSNVGRGLVILGCVGLLLIGMFRAHHLLIVFAVVVTLASYKAFRGKVWVTALGLMGIAMVIYKAPDLRFGLGYAAILFGSVPAAHSENLEQVLSQFTRSWQTHKRARLLLPLLSAVAGLAFCGYGLVLRAKASGASALTANVKESLLLPPRLPVAEVVHEQVNGIDFYRPVKGEQCWGAELPCVPNTEALQNISLRDPARGIAAGFKRVAPTGSN